MTTLHRPRAIGQAGIHIFKIAGASISGWLPFWKGSPTGRQRMPFTSLHEERAALAFLFDPRIAYAQRADVLAQFIEAHRLVYRLPTPVVIPYVFDNGKGLAEHDYYPDFAGILIGGSPFLAEAGPVRAKAAPDERAKAAAARAEMARRDGAFYLVTGESLSETRWANYELLRSHHAMVPGYAELVAAIESPWRGDELLPLREIVERGSRSQPAELVDAVAWRRLCLAAVDGHLLADLDAGLLTPDTPVGILPADAPPILPPELLSDLPEAVVATTDEVAVMVPGATVDVRNLDPRRAEIVLRNERLIVDIRAGVAPVEAAQRAGISRRQVDRIVAKAELAAIEPRTVQRVVRTAAHPIYVETIHKLLRGRRQLKIRAIRESPEMHKAWLQIRADTGTAEPIPSRFVIRRLREAFQRSDALVAQRMAGTRHRERSATAIRRYVLSIPTPGAVCQVDEHQFDILLTLDDVEFASRVWGAVLIDVKTSGILAAVLSPAELVEEDYMRLLRQAIESKGPLVARFGCEHDWTCSARPAGILSDRGLIFRSDRSTSVVVDRLGIMQAIAPPWAPSAKGTVEAIFRFMTERFAHRFPATTKGSPAQRGTHDPAATAARVRMTFAEFEGYFYRAIVDGYMQAWDELRGGVRSALWDDAVARFGVSRWLGTTDELKLLLMRAYNRKHPKGLYPTHKNGWSFLNHWYVGHEGLTARMREGKQAAALYFDRRDIVTVYLADEDGTILGAASTDELGPGPVSIWEAEARRKAQAGPRAAAEASSSASLTQIQIEAARRRGPSRRATRAANRRSARERLFADQVDDIHLTGVVAERDEMARRRAEEAAGIVRLGPELPGPATEPRPHRRPRIVYLDGRTGA